MIIEQDLDTKNLKNAIQKQDPRDILSMLRIPTAEEHEEWIATPLRRVKPPSDMETTE